MLSYLTHLPTSLFTSSSLNYLAPREFVTSFTQIQRYRDSRFSQFVVNLCSTPIVARSLVRDIFVGVHFWLLIRCLRCCEHLLGSMLASFYQAMKQDLQKRIARQKDDNQCQKRDSTKKNS